MPSLALCLFHTHSRLSIQMKCVSFKRVLTAEPERCSNKFTYCPPSLNNPLAKIMFFLMLCALSSDSSLSCDSPRGLESGDLVVHVTVIIFFNGDKDTDSRDSAYSFSSPATPILFWDSVSVPDRNEISQRKASPYCVQKNSLTRGAMLCVCAHRKKHTPSCSVYTCRPK